MHVAGGHNLLARSILFGLALNTPHALVAQQNDGGVLATLTFSETLRRDDDGVFARSDLDFSFSTVTRRDRFELDLGGVYDLALDSDDSSDFDDPFANLLYRREGANALFETRLSFRRRDIEDSVTLDDVGDTGLIIDEGQREDASAAIVFEWGREAPFGGRFDATYRTRRFLDLTSTGLQDSDDLDTRLRFDFEIDPQITAFTRLTYRDIEREGGTNSRVTNFAIGADVAFSQTLTGSFDIGQSRSRESGPGADADRDGLSATAELTQALQNGELTGTFNTRIGENGRQSTLRLSRAIELRDGSFEAGIGYGEIEGNGNALFTLAYQQERKRSNISFRFDQSFSSANDGSAVLNSSLGLNYRQELTSRSAVSLAVNYRETDPVASTIDGTEQISVNVSYDHELTDRWSFIGGLTHVRRRSDSGTETSDDTIFVGLTTVLSWRP